MEKQKIKKLIDELYKEEASKERDIYLFEGVNEESSERIIKKLIKLDKENPEEDINLYISSFGGSVYSALSIYDTIQNMNCRVNTIATGKAMSAGSLILTGGTGTRYAYPNTTIMEHELSIGYYTKKITDIEVAVEQAVKLNERITKIYSKNTGQPVEKIEKDFKRDKYMTAEEALEYGLIDEII